MYSILEPIKVINLYYKIMSKFILKAGICFAVVFIEKSIFVLNVSQRKFILFLIFISKKVFNALT